MKFKKLLALTFAVILTVLGSTTAASAASKFTASPSPVIQGRAIVGESLSVDTGSWLPSPESVAFQWKVNGKLITEQSGGRDASFEITQAHLNKSITVSVTGYLFGYKTVTRDSKAVKVQKPFESYQPPAIPEEVWVGDIVSPWCGLDDCSAPCLVNDGSWDVDEEGNEVWIDGEEGCLKYGATPTLKDSWYPIPSSMKYQWFRGGVLIKGATSNFYSVVRADLGAALSLQVTGTKSGFETLKLTSNASSPVQERSFTTTYAPSLSEEMTSPSYGDTLIATAPEQEWEPAPDAYKYQWLRDGQPIPGANKTSYTLTIADIGARISFGLTGLIRFYQEIERTTIETDIVSKAEMSVPDDSKIAGVLAVGKTVVAPVANWTPAKPKFSFQWLRDDEVIPGATKSSYKLTQADLDTTISVLLSASQPGFEDQTQVVTAENTVLARTFTAAPKPTISGSLSIGSILTAKTGRYTPAAESFEYQWLRDGVEISGETEETYELTDEDAGRKISVVVLATTEGLAASEQSSSAISRWAVKTAKITLDGPDVISLCDSSLAGSCYAETEEVCTDEYEDEYGDWVEGDCSDEETGWFGLSTGQGDDGEYSFDQSFTIALEHKPITWKTSFLGSSKGAYIFGGSYGYKACDTSERAESKCDAAVNFKSSKSASVRNSGLSKLSSDSEVTFRLFSSGEENIFWITRIVITYTYYA